MTLVTLIAACLQPKGQPQRGGQVGGCAGGGLKKALQQFPRLPLGGGLRKHEPGQGCRFFLFPIFRQ